MSTNLTWKDELVNDELQRLENQFTNLNLNHSNLCLLSFNNIKTNVSSTSKMKVYNEEQNNNNDRRYSKKEDSKKSSDIPFELPDNYVHDKRESRSSLKRDPNVNSSTLSLHIAAYEKFVDGEDLRDLLPDKLPKQKNTISIDPFIKLAVFEFPRQQNDNDKVPDPEISQFKASQKLLNPKGITTEVSVNCKILNEIFKTQPGIKRCEWRKQILIASGCSRYIPSQNILWSISRIEKETIAKCKKLLSAAYDTVSVVIGDRAEWEKIFLTETSKNDAQPVVVETADEKLKRLEKELENAQIEKAKTDEECLKLKDIVKQKEDRIDELELRYSVEQKRNLEKLAKIDKLEAKTATVSEEMVQKDKQLCELMGNLKIKDKEIIKLAETNLTVVQKKDDQICEIMAEIKLKDETINDLWKLIASLIPGSPALNQIFCHHHIMASSWEVFIKSCFAYEKLIFDNDSLKFSTFQTAIQFISSTYGERANAPAKAKEFMDWAAKKGYKIAKFSSKLGARWNIGFSISSQLYFNRKILLEFLKETNYIIEDSHSALVKVLEWPAFIVLMQIGSWIDQVINGPWWSSMDSDMHIIEQNINSAKMINYLEQVAANPILFKDDSIFPLITERSAQQISFRNAVLANVTDAFIDIMPQFCKDLADYLNKQLNALLEDAAINDEDNREILASASVSNKVSEQIFGMTTDKRHLSSSLSVGRIAASVAGTKNRTMEYIKSLSSTEFEELRKKFKAAKVSHRQKRIEDKRNLDKEIAEHYDKTQEKQRKKKQKGEVEINYDKYIGQNFVEKWGETEVEYEGVVTKKMGDGYELYYPGYQQYDLYTEDELVDLIATKKIIFYE